MTRTRRPFTLAALTLCAACALLQAGSPARADLNITTFPYTISGNVSGNVTIGNPYSAAGGIVTVAPAATITGNVTVWHSAIMVAPTATITGNASLWNNSSMNSGGQVGGTVAAHNTSFVKVTAGSLGKLSLYDKSGTTLQNSGQSSITLGGLDCFNNSSAYAAGHALSGHSHSINIKLLYLHDATAANMSGVDIPSGLWTEGMSYTGLAQSTIGFEVGAGGSRIDMDSVYISAGIMQFDSSLINIYGASTVMSTISAFGWADGKLPQGYSLAGGIQIGGGMYYGRLYAEGGEIDILGGAIVNGPLYADPKAAYNQHSMYIHGHKLVISNGYITGFVADNWPINVPCDGAIDINNNF